MARTKLKLKSITTGTLPGAIKVASENINGTLPSALTVGSAVAEDTKVVFDGNAQDFHIGLDDSTDSLTVGLGSALGTTSHMIINASGQVRKPNTPSFLTYGAPTMSSPSAGSGYFYNFGNTAQSFDNGGHYDNSTGKFTCPVAGKYMFGLSICRGESYSGNNQLIYVSKNSTASGGQYVGSNASGSEAYDQIQCHFIYDMAANDYALGTFYVSGGTFSRFASTPRNYFYGFLIG